MTPLLYHLSCPIISSTTSRHPPSNDRLPNCPAALPFPSGTYLRPRDAQHGAMARPGSQERARFFSVRSWPSCSVTREMRLSVGLVAAALVVGHGLMTVTIASCRRDAFAAVQIGAFEMASFGVDIRCPLDSCAFLVDVALFPVFHGYGNVLCASGRAAGTVCGSAALRG